jgi:alcohol dehydrogenase (cytochrome c)
MPLSRLAAMFAVLAATFGPGLLHGQARAQPKGHYTDEQADRGLRVYGAYCAACHGAEMEGALGPTLTGPMFAFFWGNGVRTVDDLFHILRTTMPRPAAGSLSEESYLDVLAYILKRNGVPSGPLPLTAQPEVLKSTPLMVMAASGGPPPKPPAPPAFIPGDRGRPIGTGPSQADLDRAASSDDWLYHNRDYGGSRYSGLSQINRANVARLAVACSWELGEFVTFQTGPIVAGGVMYVTGANVTAALDAATCRQRWRHVWTPRDLPVWPNNRGVAVKDGYVIRGTSDGYMVALDAADGQMLWARQVARPAEGETITMPPLIFEDLVLIGPAGSENNAQGWIGAFRLADGTPVWRFNTVPRPGEPGAETWANPKNIPMGGGAIWTPLSLDPTDGSLHVAVTNPAPDFPAHLRPGKNLYTNALVVLDVRTGKLRWYDQLVPSDDRDYDLTQVSPLIRASAAGRERRLVVTVGKDGLLRPIDRDTRERLFETAVTTRLNTDTPLGATPLRHCPGTLGGVEWNGPAYHPGTNLLYVPAVDWCATSRVDSVVRFVPGQNYMGGTSVFDATRQGWLTAVAVSDGSVRWRYRSKEPMVGAVTATAGGLVFTGEITGDFLAFDAETGQELFRHDTGGPIGGGVVTYAVSGRQYVAVTSGRASIWFGIHGSPRIMVYALPAS